MKSVYLTIRVDFDTDSEEQANQWAESLVLIEERQNMAKHIDGIEVCGINN